MSKYQDLSNTGQPYVIPADQTTQAPPYLGQPPAYPQQQPGHPPPTGPAYPAYVGPQPMQPVGEGGPHSINADVESAKDITEEWSSFSNKAIRQAFVRKVYAILMVQLAFSLGIICLFVFEEHVKEFVQSSVAAYMAAYIVFLVVYIALVCCKTLRRTYPTNLTLLAIFTVAMSYLLGAISSFHETRIVLIAVGICGAICLGVSVFSFNTKYDFTSCAGVLIILAWGLFVFGIVTIFTYTEILNTVYAGCGAVLFTLFLAFDTQMIMGGKKYEISPEEHIFAALMLYMDIAYIFMYLLMAMGKRK